MSSKLETFREKERDKLRKFIYLSQLVCLFLAANLKKQFDLKAGRRIDSKCVEVNWSKIESGDCYVKYDMRFKNASGKYLPNKSAYNVGEMKLCNLTDYDNITKVELTVRLQTTARSIKANVSNPRINSPATGMSRKKLS